MSEAKEIEVQGGDWTRETLRGTVRPPPGPGVRTGPFEILRKLLGWWTEVEERLGRPPWRPGRAGMTDSEAGPGQGLGERWMGLGFGGWDGDPHALLFPPDQPWEVGGQWHPHYPLSSSPWNRGALLPGAQGAPSGEHTLEVSGCHLGEISFNLTPNNNFSAFLIASSCAGPCRLTWPPPPCTRPPGTGGSRAWSLSLCC